MPAPSGSPWLEGWTGFGGTNNWYGGWAGFNYAFNHNVWSDGLLLRAEGGAGHYDYPTTALPGGVSNVTYDVGALLLGWRRVLPGFIGQTTTLSGYVGAEVQDHNNSDPTAAVRGTQWGVKFVGEMYTRLSQYQDFYGQATFSSAFDTWLLLARPGWLVPAVSGTEVWIGPDMSVFGNGQGWLVNASHCPNAGTSGTVGGLGSCKYDEGRIGAFLHFIIPNVPVFGDWIVAGGYRKPLLTNGGPDGYYAQIGMNFRFY